MIACPALIALSMAAYTGSDPSALVRQLGAPKYADRQAAALEIEKMGAAALPSLRTARSASDAEIRSRAEVLVERIENDLMVRPTMVVLDFDQTPIGQVLASVSERGQATLRLAPGSQTSASRRITLTRPEKVPFWEAVALVAEAGGLELVGGATAVAFGPNGPQPAPLVLFESPPTMKPTPVSLSGPFRVTLLNIWHHKERVFEGNPAAPVFNGMGLNGMQQNVPGFAMPQAGAVPVEGNADQFLANIQVVAEPRMNIAINGQPRLQEAVDDLGHSLLPVSQSVIHHSGYNQFEMPQSAIVQAGLTLRFPAQAGKTIRRLKGTVPITVTARKDDPIIIPLAGAKGRMYHNPEISLTIHDVNSDPNSGQTLIDLSIRPNSGPIDPNGRVGGPGFSTIRGAGSSQNPFDIVDAKGHVLNQWQLISQMQTLDGMRATIRVSSPQGASPATHLRYHELSRVNTEADFEFVDIDMP